MNNTEYTNLRALAFTVARANADRIFDEIPDEQGARLFDVLLPEVDDRIDLSHLPAMDISDVAYEVVSELRDEFTEIPAFSDSEVEDGRRDRMNFYRERDYTDLRGW